MSHSPIQFPPELPITARVVDIAKAIDGHQVVIVAGATGSGKTTQLPKIALAMGRGIERMIGVTQPRRIAATSVAARVASELGSPLGTDVGYQIRFDDRTSKNTYVKFMTDGILLAEIQGDRLLRKYDTLIIDEAHERSLTIDFLLGWMRRILPERPDLKVIVSSATLETSRFSAFFGDAPVIEVEGRTFPVEVLYEPPLEDTDLPDAVADAVANITSLDPHGDILVFLPGEREIRESEKALLARSLRHTVILPLYARLAAGEQGRVFSTIPQRRVILATNVAETSLTIPGIVYVVDTGVARLSRYESRSGITRLQIEGISQASADQRKGRCGRVREGICVRLYDETSFAARPGFTDPEIKRTGLAGVILRMKALGLGDVEDFPFLDPPHSRSITEGYRVLEELGALGDHRELTPLGERLSRFPVDPRIGRMILAGAELGCLKEVLVIAAALNIQDPRERPLAHQQRADELHRRFRDERSDFVGLLRLWEFVREAESKGTGNLRRVCKDGFLSFLRVREWGEIHRQLAEVVRELRLGEPSGDRGGKSERPPRGKGDAISVEPGEAFHVALLTGLLSRIGQWNPEHRVYLGARQTRFSLHPSSALARKPPAWIMAFELVETTQLFARTAAKIEPEWLEQAGHHLLKRSYSDPHWSEKSGRASIKEHATLFGLPVRRDHSVDYATVAPVEARLMFLDHALVRGEYKTRGAFHERNRALLAEVSKLRDKARRSDMLADEDALLAFFDRRIPDTVVNGKTFETWRDEAEKTAPKLLELTMADVLAGEDDLSPDAYPDAITLHGVSIPVAYRFDPAADDDGITLTVPLALLPQLDPGELDWMIPGAHAQKIAALLYELPRAIRRDLGDIPKLSREIAPRLTPFQGPMIPQLVPVVRELGGVELTDEDFKTYAVPAYLRLTCRVLGEDGKLVAQSRDIESLFEQYGARARAVWKSTAAAAAPSWEKKGLTTWDFGELPRFVTRKVSGAELRSYPALVDRGAAVDLALFETATAADASTRLGVRRLFALSARKLVSAVTTRLPPALPRPRGGMISRADHEHFRAQVLIRILDEATGIGADAELPRDQHAFDDLVVAATPRLPPAFEAFTDAIKATATELETTLRALDAASKQPSGKSAITDIRAQLDVLFSHDLITWVPLAQLRHFPRYLKAIRARMTRAVADPRKDADKQATFSPALGTYLAKRDTAKDRQSVDELRWAFEELRVSVFAPELKTAVPVSVVRVAAAVAGLRLALPCRSSVRSPTSPPGRNAPCAGRDDRASRGVHAPRVAHQPSRHGGSAGPLSCRGNAHERNAIPGHGAASNSVRTAQRHMCRLWLEPGRRASTDPGTDEVARRDDGDGAGLRARRGSRQGRLPLLRGAGVADGALHEARAPDGRHRHYLLGHRQDRSRRGRVGRAAPGGRDVRDRAWARRKDSREHVFRRPLCCGRLRSGVSFLRAGSRPRDDHARVLGPAQRVDTGDPPRRRGAAGGRGSGGHPPPAREREPAPGVRGRCSSDQVRLGRRRDSSRREAGHRARQVRCSPSPREPNPRRSDPLAAPTGRGPPSVRLRPSVLGADRGARCRGVRPTRFDPDPSGVAASPINTPEETSRTQPSPERSARSAPRPAAPHIRPKRRGRTRTVGAPHACRRRCRSRWEWRRRRPDTGSWYRPRTGGRSSRPR